MGYGGNTPCLELRAPTGEILIFDAGTGARPLGTALVQEQQRKGTPPQDSRVDIFLTHFHWDHIQGIPFFAPLYQQENHIRFFSHAPIGPLKQVLEGQMAKPYFPVNFESATHHREFIELSAEGWNQSGLRIQPFLLNHPQGSSGYRIEAEGTVLVYATDHEHGIPELDSGLRQFAEGADLLIYDAQYTPEEYEQHRGWGHSTWTEAVSVAQDAKVKQLVLFHHDPSHNDEAVRRIMEQARRKFANTLAAREGWTIEF